MYLRSTTEVIANFVGVEYGRDMRMLVKCGHREDLRRTKDTNERRHYSRIDGEVQDRTPDFPPREERISRQQSKGIWYHSRTVHSQCEEQIGKRIRICYLGNEWQCSWLVKAAKGNGVCIRRGSTSILDTPDCYAASTSYQSRTKRVGYQLLQKICFKH
jgi:hypothetical protein